MTVRLIGFDVDGCLTDGKLYSSNTPGGSRAFNTQDGLGCILAHSVGIKLVAISGKTCEQTNLRLEGLGFSAVFGGVKDKLGVLKSYCEQQDISLEDSVFMGDDYIDLAVMDACGFSYAPGNALPEVKKRANFVTFRHGGDGAAREMIEHVLIKLGYDPVALYQECNPSVVSS